VKAAEAKKPDSKVLEPTPTPGQIPAPAPPFDPKDAAKDAAKAKAAADAKGVDPKADAKPAAIPATVFLDIGPWGEVFVNGKSQGVSPPKKFLKLDPGKHRIEVRNTTFAPHVQNVDLKSREEVTVRHKFQ
jgi:hypothetical protein